MTVRRLSVLVDQLLNEQGSAVARAVTPNAEWTAEAYILADLFDAYLMTHSDPRKGAPKPYPRPVEQRHQQQVSQARLEALQRQHKRMQQQQRRREGA